jgi:hypothetical protein
MEERLFPENLPGALVMAKQILLFGTTHHARKHAAQAPHVETVIILLEVDE